MLLSILYILKIVEVDAIGVAVQLLLRPIFRWGNGLRHHWAASIESIALILCLCREEQSKELSTPSESCKKDSVTTDSLKEDCQVVISVFSLNCAAMVPRVDHYLRSIFVFVCECVGATHRTRGCHRRHWHSWQIWKRHFQEIWSGYLCPHPSHLYHLSEASWIPSVVESEVKIRFQCLGLHSLLTGSLASNFIVVTYWLITIYRLELSKRSLRMFQTADDWCSIDTKWLKYSSRHTANTSLVKREAASSFGMYRVIEQAHCLSHSALPHSISYLPHE